MHETSAEVKVQHLNMIQGIINRLANNSFLVKGWMITVAVAGYGFGFENGSKKIILLTMIAVILFWVIDAYYLQQERIFRRLYDLCVEGEVKPFSMNVSQIRSSAPCLMCVMLSYPTNMFYLPFLAAGFLSKF